MARYEHLPIFRAAFDLALHLEKIVQNFSRYHKYTLGTELRDRSRAVLERVIAANSASEGRQEQLLLLRAELEQLKVLVRLVSPIRRLRQHPRLPLRERAGGGNRQTE